MRTRLLLLVALLSVGFTSRAQTFENTVWNVSYFGNDFGNFMFQNGEFLWELGTWATLGQYSLAGNIMMITMPDDEDCMETGTYSFEITGNTLNFTLIDDPCDGRSDLFVTFDWVVGISTNVASITEGPAFELYPNPSNGELFVIQDQPVLISVFSLTGKLVHQQRVNDERTHIDLRDLSSGSYVLQAITPRGTISKKIVLE